ARRVLGEASGGDAGAAVGAPVERAHVDARELDVRREELAVRFAGEALSDAELRVLFGRVFAELFAHLRAAELVAGGGPQARAEGHVARAHGDDEGSILLVEAR